MVPALVALLVAAAPPPLEGCTAEAMDFGWRYECGWATAQSADLGGTGPGVDGLISATLDGLRSRGVTVTPDQQVAAGAGLEVFRIVDPDGPAVVRFQATQRRAKGVRVLACREALASSRCGAILEALAAGDWMEGPLGGAKVRAGPPTLTLAGREVPVPAGCQAERRPDRQYVACDWGALLFWSPCLSLAQAKDQAALFLDSLAKGLEVPVTDTPCRVRGAAASCRRFTFVRPDGAPRTYLAGSAIVGGTPFLVACSLEGVDVDVEPCTGIFEFGPAP